MFRFEKKLIEWMNRYMVHIALGFVILCAGYMRLAGRNYVGTDYHFALYDRVENCNSLLYRKVAFFLVSNSDLSIDLLKILAYCGDFCVALLVFLLFYQKGRKIVDLRTFLIVTACLLSPVSLIYSVGSMEIDSVSMSCVLLAVLLFQKGWILPAAPFLALAAYIYPAYWPIALMVFGSMIFLLKKKNESDLHAIVAFIVMMFCLIFSVFLENYQLLNGYYWGKIFVVNPATGEAYTNFGTWIHGMCKIYGYFVATILLVAALKYRKLRLPALIMQLLVLMYMGWQVSYHLAL